MIVLETSNAAQTKTATITLDKRISLIIVADSVDFFEKRASHISFIVVFEAPSKIDINKITASATHATINFVVKVCLRIIDIMGGYLSNPSKKGGSTADSLSFIFLI